MTKLTSWSDHWRWVLFLENLIKLAPNPTIVPFTKGCQHREKRHKSQKKTTFWFFWKRKKRMLSFYSAKKVSCWSLAELKQVLSMYFRCQRCNALDLCVVCQAFQSLSRHSPLILKLYRILSSQYGTFGTYASVFFHLTSAYRAFPGH